MSLKDKIAVLSDSLSTTQDVLPFCEASASFFMNSLPDAISREFYIPKYITSDTGVLVGHKYTFVSRGMYPCRKINPAYKQLALSGNSQHSASRLDPVYYKEGSKLYILPTPTASEAGAVYCMPTVFVHNNELVNIPEEAENIVLLHAGFLILMKKARDIRNALTSYKDDIQSEINSFNSNLPAQISINNFTISDVLSISPLVLPQGKSFDYVPGSLLVSDVNITDTLTLPANPSIAQLTLPVIPANLASLDRYSLPADLAFSSVTVEDYINTVKSVFTANPAPTLTVPIAPSMPTDLANFDYSSITSKLTSPTLIAALEKTLASTVTNTISFTKPTLPTRLDINSASYEKIAYESAEFFDPSALSIYEKNAQNEDIKLSIPQISTLFTNVTPPNAPTMTLPTDLTLGSVTLPVDTLIPASSYSAPQNNILPSGYTISMPTAPNVTGGEGSLANINLPTALSITDISFTGITAPSIPTSGNNQLDLTLETLTLAFTGLSAIPPDLSLTIGTLSDTVINQHISALAVLTASAQTIVDDTSGSIDISALITAIGALANAPSSVSLTGSASGSIDIATDLGIIKALVLDLNIEINTIPVDYSAFISSIWGTYTKLNALIDKINAVSTDTLPTIPDIDVNLTTKINDAITNASNFVGAISTVETSPRGAFWLKDEDPEMVRSSVELAAQEVNRANAIISSEINKFQAYTSSISSSSAKFNLGIEKVKTEIEATSAFILASVKEFENNLQTKQVELNARTAKLRTRIEEFQVKYQRSSEAAKLLLESQISKARSINEENKVIVDKTMAEINGFSANLNKLLTVAKTTLEQQVAKASSMNASNKTKVEKQIADINMLQSNIQKLSQAAKLTLEKEMAKNNIDSENNKIRVQDFSNKVQKYSADVNRLMQQNSILVQDFSTRAQQKMNKAQAVIQKYSADINDYQVRTNALVQKFIAETNAKINLRQVDVQSLIQRYTSIAQANIQNYANQIQSVIQQNQVEYENKYKSFMATFESGARAFDMNNQYNLGRYSQLLTGNIQKFQSESQAKIQDYSNRLQKGLSEFSSKYELDLRKFSEHSTSLIQRYQAEIQAEIQNYYSLIDSKIKAYSEETRAKLEASNIKIQAKLNAFRANKENELKAYDQEINFEIQKVANTNQAKIQEYLGKLNSIVSSEASFNQAQVQKYTAELQQAFQYFEVSLNKYTGELNKYATKISLSINRYQTEIQKNISDIQTEVQSLNQFYSQKNQLQFEQSFRKNEYELQQKIANIQNDLQGLTEYSNRLLKEYELDITKAVQKNQLDNQFAIQKFSEEASAKIQEFSAVVNVKLQQEISNKQNQIQRYSAEESAKIQAHVSYIQNKIANHIQHTQNQIAAYQAKVGLDIQNHGQNAQTALAVFQANQQRAFAFLQKIEPLMARMNVDMTRYNGLLQEAQELYQRYRLEFSQYLGMYESAQPNREG